ncbi:hypothetical protein CMV_020139 [Castanea mollissima]|uniref:Wall-associated receptor kinase C-terminal domain-containing protein n=1 Tax=Castanea mollissima TaxID=60419 RepID=A0A8J4QZG8_9ROSI|nr:hypothetical protein CMV_020139 [Castanea mollissima]
MHFPPVAIDAHISPKILASAGLNGHPVGFSQQVTRTRRDVDGVDKQNSSCGFPGFNLSFDNNGHPTIVISNNNYTIHQIFYQTETLRVSDSAFSNPNSNCIPSINNIFLPGVQFDLAPNQTNLRLFYNCNSSVHESWPPSEFYPSCYGENDTVLALSRQDPKLISNVSMGCKSSVLSPVEAYGGAIGIGESLRNGFVLKWKATDCSICENSGGYCGFDNIMYHFTCFCPDRPRVWNCTNTTLAYLPGNNKRVLVIALVTSFAGIGVLVVIFCYFCGKFSSKKIIYFWKKKTLTYQSVEAFLRKNEPLAIRRYSYSDIKKMTNSFKDKLGQGGYGGVYKGKLQDGCFVAVKVLKESKGNGEEFLNEVASINVYSYGMMVLEMVGGRKNIDVSVDSVSEIYFPHWIYKRIELDEELGLQGLISKEDEEIAKKMIMVSLWCIQTDPSSRPSISKVMDMLEGSLNSLQISPKPFLCSPPRTTVDSSTATVSV